MGTVVKSGYCKTCKAQRKVERDKPNHLLHLVLSILTAGIWLIVWIGVSVSFGGWRCNTCGSKKIGRVK